MGDSLGWNNPRILAFDPNFQRDIQAWNNPTYRHWLPMDTLKTLYTRIDASLITASHV